MRRRNTATWTSIIVRYARKGLGEEAISLFPIMQRRPVSSNNLTIVSMLKVCGSIGALFAGRKRCCLVDCHNFWSRSLGHESEALGFLKEMMEEGVEPNSFTYSSALKACANLETVRQGKLIHSNFANKTPAPSNHTGEEFGYFEGHVRDWLCREALKLMYRMQAEGIQVDDFVSATVPGGMWRNRVGYRAFIQVLLEH
ncbi:hypothetical protein NC652_006037 [Populus alba x Populus x berolinensis]|nr:hypothetical protein NC652_006037 [Populus alba x Populus x berolinensis]